MQASQGQILLFIDELHTVVGAGAAEGAMDAANLTEADVGSWRTTSHWCHDASMNTGNTLKRMPRLNAGFNPSSSISLRWKIRFRSLRGLRERYEVHHGVRIKDSALVAAARLSHRYIGDRFLPDKAIDLIDESAARLRTEIDSMPAEMDEISRKVLQLEIEREALKKETDSASQARLANLEAGTEDANKRALAELTTRWDAEKSAVGKLQELRESMEKVKQDIAQAERKL